MNMFQNPGIGLGSNNWNRRRAREGSANGDGGRGGGGGGIVSVSDKHAKSLLRERDAKIAALEKEVLGLQNKISTLSKEQAAKGQTRAGKKGLTPYGNTVRVSTSKCSAKRRQLLAERARMGRNASISTQAILNALPDEQSPKEALINRIQDMFRSAFRNPFLKRDGLLKKSKPNVRLLHSTSRRNARPAARKSSSERRNMLRNTGMARSP